MTSIPSDAVMRENARLNDHRELIRTDGDAGEKEVPENGGEVEFR